MTADCDEHGLQFFYDINVLAIAILNTKIG